MTKSIARSAISILLVPVLVTGALASLAGCKKKDDASASGDGGTAATSNAAGGETLGTGFEGAITMHLTSAHRPAGDDITFLSKADKLRFDAPAAQQHAGATHIIFDGVSKEMTIVMDGQKSYMNMDMPQLTAAALQAQGGHAPSAQATVTKTGKHETIAGYDCEDWTIKEPSGKQAQACIADGIGFIDFANLGPGAAPGGSPAWMTELHEKREFPLKAIDMDATGKETSRMEVTKIEKKKLDDSTFAIPAGYKKIEIPHFPGGMPGMPGGGQGLPSGFPGAPPHAPPHH